MNLYEGWTQEEAVFLAACSVIVVIGVISFLVTVTLFRLAKKHNNPQANALTRRVLAHQLKFYHRQLMIGYYKHREKDWGVGLLALSVPAVTAEEVNQSFSNGLFTIFKGAWDILAPYVGAVLVLWIIFLVIQRVSGGKTRR